MSETKKRTATRRTLRSAQLSVMREVGYVQKTEQGQLNYRFVGEAEIIRKLRPAMIKAGISVCPVDVEIVSESEYLAGRNQTRMGLLLAKVVYKFSAHGEEQLVTVLAEASDMGDKRGPKLMTIALKYALRQFFLLETGEDPDEVVNHRSAPNVDTFRRALSAINSATDGERLSKLGDEFLRDKHGFDAMQMEDLNSAISRRRHQLRLGS